ncbi:hypothetical protein B0T19DRAFT_380035 [Cercophora scortea]|uniref:Glucose-methanol-choline oxidoreductase N-terminal domain-containing protein n=1 Tax=Cercophora scortea TaxID=314031 RepID=A0AAE0IUJ5_9PEZI|nr:hypothetical protein B0T19DRAFT_380035 [Cercophora scortea]
MAGTQVSTATGTHGAIKNTYDYVIIGGGTAGLTVGDRLSESGKCKKLSTPSIRRVSSLTTFQEPEGYRQGQTTYNITSAPSPGLNNRTFQVDVGCIVGGSSAINGRIFQRGTAKDYEIWDELGGIGNKSTWNWENLLGYFKKGITLTPPKPEIPAAFDVRYDTQYWGHNTSNHSIFATFGNLIKPSVFPMHEAIKKFPGIELSPDGGSGQHGMYYYMTSSDPHTGRRSYSRTGHWDGLNRTNYDLLVATRVNKIVFERGTAVGVQITPRGGDRRFSSIVRARKEVILAAGSLHTPQILQLSGIGPANLLKRAKIPVEVDLPGVGSNFQDHAFIPEVSFRWGTAPLTPFSLTNTTIIPDGLGGISLGVSIPLPVVSPGGFSSIASRFETQDPAAYLPKGTHATVIEGYLQQKRIYAREMRLRSFSALRFSVTGEPSFQPINIHPVSRGTVYIDPDAAPETEPIVDYRAASNPIDIDIAVAEIKFLRQLMTTGELAQYNATELAPGSEYDTDEKLGAWVRGKIIPSVYHPVGTTPKMPRERGGVVGEDLLVYGVKRLSVVDASIMPTIVAATTSMSVYAIAEKAADLIKARQ